MSLARAAALAALLPALSRAAAVEVRPAGRSTAGVPVLAPLAPTFSADPGAALPAFPATSLGASAELPRASAADPLAPLAAALAVPAPALGALLGPEAIPAALPAASPRTRASAPAAAADDEAARPAALRTPASRDARAAASGKIGAAVYDRAASRAGETAAVFAALGSDGAVRAAPGLAPAFASTTPFPEDLKLRLREELGGLGRGVPSIAPGRGWFTHGRRRARLEFWGLGKEDAGRVAVRFGPILFLDEAVQRRLSPGLRAALASRVILMKDIGGSSLYDPLAYYAFPGAAILLDTPLSGRRMVDAGAGDGVFALLAWRLGAERVDLIELDPATLARARANLAANGLREGREFTAARADLTRTPEVLRALRPTRLPTVVVGSVGSWASDYTAANADVLAAAVELENLERIVLTGYASGAPNGGLSHLYWDEEVARGAGWRESGPRGSWSRRMADLWPENRNNYFHLAVSLVPSAPADPAAFARLLQRRRGSHQGALSGKALRGG